MTVEEMLELARSLAGNDYNPQHQRFVIDSKRLARAVVDLLGSAMPCGWPEPEVCDVEQNAVFPGVAWEAHNPEATTDEWRGICAAILTACDAADAAEQEGSK